MKRYTQTGNEYECRMKNCNMENYLRTFDVNTDIVDFCEDCPFMEAINTLAEYEDDSEANAKEAFQFQHQFDHG